VDAWDPTDPFVTDANGFVVGLSAAPPHHARLLAEGWEGGRGLFPLVAASPEAFSADVLVYRHARLGTLTAVLSETPPYCYRLGRSLRRVSPTPREPAGP
jgi:hypothetical protein